MSKNKDKKNKSTKVFESLAARAGYFAMLTAAIISLVELHNVRAYNFLNLAPPSFSTVSHAPSHESGGEELMRREKEEIRHAGVSYGVTMRSHPTAGTV